METSTTAPFANLTRRQAERMLAAEFTARRASSGDMFATAEEMKSLLADPLSNSDLSFFKVETAGSRFSNLGGRITFSAR